MAAHYATAIVPTRGAGVQFVDQLADRGIEFAKREEPATAEPFAGSATAGALFEAIERPALQSLPAEPFEYAEWKRCRAGLDYHIEVHGRWSLVPYRLIREVVEARITDRAVEVFHHGVRVAVHVRNPMRHRHTTVPDHMPSAHRRYADWTAARLQGFRACLGILRLVRSYGVERVEAACQRGIDIGAHTYSSRRLDPAQQP
jgi:transposase